jgi:hypothetical protein
MRYTFALMGLAVMVAAAPMKMHIGTTTPPSLISSTASDSAVDTTTSSSDAINIPIAHDNGTPFSFPQTTVTNIRTDKRDPASPAIDYGTYGPYGAYYSYPRTVEANMEKRDGVEDEANPAHHPVIKDTRAEHGPVMKEHEPVMKSTTSTSKTHEMKRSVDHPDATEVSATARSSGGPLPYNWYGKYDPYANYGEYKRAEKQAEGAGAGLMDA